MDDRDRSGACAGPTAAIVSFRLGGTDGVSVEASKWHSALQALGWRVVSIAGEGDADHIVPGLAMGATFEPAAADLETLLSVVDLAVVENICSLPLNPPAAKALASALEGRPAILHHHDLPWEREAFAGWRAPWPPDDPCWRHVCISEHARNGLVRRGIEAVRIYNSFDPSPPLGSRTSARAATGVASDEPLIMQPTRAIERKNIPLAVDLAARLGATYWLLGEAEDGYHGELERVLGGARGRVLHGRFGLSVADAYAGCDVVALVSSREGFGNPAIEAGLHGRALVIGDYPVATELAGYGFRWFSPEDEDALASYLADPDPAIVAWNGHIARQHFSTAGLPAQIEALLASMGRVVGRA